MNDGKIIEKTLEKKWDSWNIINGSFRKNTGKVTPNFSKSTVESSSGHVPLQAACFFFLPQPVSEDKRASRREVCHQGRVMKINDDINLL